MLMRPQPSRQWVQSTLPLQSSLLASGNQAFALEDSSCFGKVFHLKQTLTSGTPPTAVDTTSSPAAAASTTAMQKASVREALMKIWPWTCKVAQMHQWATCLQQDAGLLLQQCKRRGDFNLLAQIVDALPPARPVRMCSFCCVHADAKSALPAAGGGQLIVSKHGAADRGLMAAGCTALVEPGSSNCPLAQA